MDIDPTGADDPRDAVSRQRPDAEVVLHEERLALATERVATERVRISKRIVTTTRTVEVPVRVEQLVVTREPVAPGDVLDAVPGTAGRGGEDELVLVLHEEVPEVTLRVVPVERVRVAVRTVAEEHQVVAPLSAEAVHVDVVTEPVTVPPVRGRSS